MQAHRVSLVFPMMEFVVPLAPSDGAPSRSAIAAACAAADACVAEAADPTDARAQARLAAALERAGRSARAVAACRLALAARPADARTRARLARLLDRAGETCLLYTSPSPRD